MNSVIIENIFSCSENSPLKIKTLQEKLDFPKCSRRFATKHCLADAHKEYINAEKVSERKKMRQLVNFILLRKPLCYVRLHSNVIRACIKEQILSNLITQLGTCPVRFHFVFANRNRLETNDNIRQDKCEVEGAVSYYEMH